MPREGVDYIIDLYQVANVEQNAAEDEVKQALNARALEYHPDRLQGLAPEFIEKGERVARLLNRARTVLLDPDKRQEYDEILFAWDGPVSTDGTPVIRVGDALRADMAMKKPEEIESIFTEQRDKAIALTGHDPKKQEMFARMLETAEGRDAAEIREAYDEALSSEDLLLDIEASERGRLISLPEEGLTDVSIGYEKKVQLAIEIARTTQTEEYKRRAIGGVSARLALLAGETEAVESGVAVMPTDTQSVLPHYFDEQSKHITSIATKREEILAKRLDIFEPSYPIAEIQTETHPDFAVGVTHDKDSAIYYWFGFNFDKETVNLISVDLPEDIRQHLADGQFEEVYVRGFNIVSFVAKPRVDIHDLLEEAYNKHIKRFFPGSLDD
ncbi:MAG: J domain-containing protein [Candidatus Saccharibacteria bacterium]